MKKDIIIMGAVSGFVGNVFKLAFVFILHYLDYIEYSFGHIAAGYFVHGSDINSSISLLNGYVSDFIFAGMLGIVIYLILMTTGFAFAEVKGVFLGSLIHVINNGVLLFSNINNLPQLPPLTNFLLLFPSTIFGLVTCIFLKKFHK